MMRLTDMGETRPHGRYMTSHSRCQVRRKSRLMQKGIGLSQAS